MEVSLRLDGHEELSARICAPKGLKLDLLCLRKSHLSFLCSVNTLQISISHLSIRVNHEKNFPNRLQKDWRFLFLFFLSFSVKVQKGLCLDVPCVDLFNHCRNPLYFCSVSLHMISQLYSGGSCRLYNDNDKWCSAASTVDGFLRFPLPIFKLRLHFSA